MCRVMQLGLDLAPAMSSSREQLELQLVRQARGHGAREFPLLSLIRGFGENLTLVLRSVIRDT